MGVNKKQILITKTIKQNFATVILFLSLATLCHVDSYFVAERCIKTKKCDPDTPQSPVF